MPYPLRHLLAAAAALIATASAAPACAAPLVGVLADYNHTQWTAAEGAPSGILTMTQTPDGWLWLGTADGLYRFDGVRFERYPLPPRVGLNRDRIFVLHAADNGDLFISYTSEGLSVLHPDGRVESLPTPPDSPGSISAMAIDRDGSLWVIAGNIAHFRDGRWQVVEQGPEWRGSAGLSLQLDAQGRLWAVNDRGAWQLQRETGRFARVGDGGGGLLLAPGGALWQVGDLGAIRHLAPGGGARPPMRAHAESGWTGVFDGDGALWLLKCPQGACRVRPGALPADGGGSAAPVAVAALDALPALSGEETSGIIEDREGDIWIATEKGLDRFRRNRLLQGGLAGPGTRYTLASDGQGRMWAAQRPGDALWQLPAGAPPRAQAGAPVALVANGRGGDLLTGDPRVIRRIRAGKVEEFPLPPGPDGKPRDHYVLGMLDDGKVLWTATLQTGLLGWRDGRWLPRGAFNLPQKIFQSAPAGVGQLWLATGDGTLVFYDDGKLTTYDIRAVETVAGLFPGGEPLISGSGGAGIFRDGRLRMLRAANPEVLRNVSGLVATRDGDRWLNGAAGLVHVLAQDWRRSLADPAQPLRYALLGAADGYPGRAMIESRLPSAMSADGRRLWLLGTGGVVTLDTAALRRNGAAPRPVIVGVTTDQGVYPARASLRLPPGSSRFRIDFTAPALRMPEGLRFEYRLEGVDAGWSDAGARRGTSYTNIGAGDYVFRLRAFNEDGVAGEREASMRLTVEPTLAQSAWFRVACALALAALAAALYRYRVRRLAVRLAERLEVRTAERERIARTLHDSFLQTIYALILRLHAVAMSLPEGGRAREQLDAVLDQASGAIDEGRDQLQQLRAGDTRVAAQALADLVERLRLDHAGIAIALRIDGAQRPLHAPVADELVAIAGEALRNACQHAGAGAVRVRLAYGPRRLALTVSDDGAGIATQVLRDGGREGHWGLAGMRERAQRIGGRVTIANGEDGGACVTLTVPAAQAYAPR
jgi:signal transduction histidine kinase/sugar lactone lactonase YvrE